MLAALEASMPAGVRWTGPKAGCSSGSPCPSRSTRARLLERSIAEAGVAFVPGAAFFPDRSVHNALRLSYSLNPPREIADGIARLAEVIRDAMSEAATAHPVTVASGS